MHIIRTKKIQIDYRKIALGSLSGAFFSCLFLYAYFLNASVVSIVERKDTQEQIATAHSQLSALEAEYFDRIGSINLDLAYASGFAEAKNSSFVYRTNSLGRSVSLNQQ